MSGKFTKLVYIDGIGNRKLFMVKDEDNKNGTEIISSFSNYASMEKMRRYSAESTPIKEKE